MCFLHKMKPSMKLGETVQAPSRHTELLALWLLDLLLRQKWEWSSGGTSLLEFGPVYLQYSSTQPHPQKEVVWLSSFSAVMSSLQAAPVTTLVSR